MTSKSPRIRMIVDVPVGLFPELTGLIQLFAKERNEIVLVATSPETIPEKLQIKMREALHKVLKSPDATLKDSFQIMSDVSNELKDSHITEVRIKKKELGYVG